jgi:hypothetical protein
LSKKQAPARHGASTGHDQQIWERIEKLVEKGGHKISDILESFPVYARRVNITRFLAHYELYRQIKDLPGNIVEIGVYRGASLMSWAKFLEIFHGGDRTRRVYGFDNFAGFEKLHEKDGGESDKYERHVGGWNAGPYRHELEEHVDIFHDDSFVPRAKRIQLIEGDISKTAQKFVDDNPGLRISLLHLDVDLYEPTLAALKAFYPCVVKGGLVVFDEYAQIDWPGESKAAEEYFGKNMPRLQKFPFSSLPGGFFVKD